MEIHQTSQWTFRHEPGVSLSAEPSGQMPWLMAGLLAFVLTILTFFFVFALQLVLSPPLAWLIAFPIGLATWITLAVYRKRNVVLFDPPLLVEHRRRPWGWRRTALSFPLDDIRVVAETRSGLTSVDLTYRLSLRSGTEEREFCTERNLHRRFTGALGGMIADGLGCPYEDQLDHERIRSIEPGEAREAPPARLEDGQSNKGFGCMFMAFGAMVIFILVFVAAPDALSSDGLLAAIIVGVVMPTVPAFFFFIGLKMVRSGKNVLDYESRVVGIDVSDSAEEAKDPISPFFFSMARRMVRVLKRLLGRESPVDAASASHSVQKAARILSFDTPDAHVVIYCSGSTEHGNEGMYVAYLCAGPEAVPLPSPAEMTTASEDLFPWVRETANQLGLPIELVGESTLTAWDRQVEAGSLT